MSSGLDTAKYTQASNHWAKNRNRVRKNLNSLRSALDQNFEVHRISGNISKDRHEKRQETLSILSDTRVAVQSLRAFCDYLDELWSLCPPDLKIDSENALDKDDEQEQIVLRTKYIAENIETFIRPNIILEQGFNKAFANSADYIQKTWMTLSSVLQDFVCAVNLRIVDDWDIPNFIDEWNVLLLFSPPPEEDYGDDNI